MLYIISFTAKELDMYQLEYRAKIPLNLKESWKFFSDPKNLKLLTPPEMGFEILNNELPGEMYPGQLIIYRVKPIWNIPMKWVTEITHVEKEVYFIDEQRSGPYTIWHHEHRFREISGGTEMVDKIYYKPPLGPIGKVLNAVKIEHDINSIFVYRANRLIELFGIFKK
jgi:ligand-binding SRPBCC domain-containing protein